MDPSWVGFKILSVNSWFPRKLIVGVMNINNISIKNIFAIANIRFYTRKFLSVNKQESYHLFCPDGCWGKRLNPLDAGNINIFNIKKFKKTVRNILYQQ